MSKPTLRVDKLGHRYGDHEVLADVDLEVSHGELVVVVGPSGCGKTTLLNLLAGHLEATTGRIERNGGSRMIYQEGGLFPWLTARQNIGMATGVAKKIDDLIELVSLRGFEDHYPHQLSGGMRQRVELARALAAETDLLLMDEPFSALDYQTRVRMRWELGAALERRPRTVVFVTHDLDEAAQLADRIVVLAGRPARFKRELKVSVPRPRDPTDPAVVDATKVLLEEMGLS